jgi:hypothetical protein
VQRVQRITEDELAFLGKLGAFVRTPRDAKRLFNLYRLLRLNAYRISGRGGEDPAAFLDGGYQAVAVLLAMLTLDARVLREVLDAPARAQDQARPGSGTAGGLAARPTEGVSWRDFTADLVPRPGPQQANGARPAWRNQVVGDIPAERLRDWERMSAAVQATVAGNLLTTADLKDFQAWAPYVRRFSYELLAEEDPDPAPLA